MRRRRVVALWPQVMATDDHGRPSVSSADLDRIREAFAQVPAGKRGALLVIADETGTRAHLAAAVGDHWKIAAGGGVSWKERKPTGYVAVEATW